MPRQARVFVAGAIYHVCCRTARREPVFADPRFVQRTELTVLQQEYLKVMQVAPPPRFERIEAKPRRTAAAKATP